LEEGFFMLDEDLGSDSEDEIDDEECKDETIDQLALSMPIHRVRLDRLQTENIMGITHFLPKPWKNLRRSSTESMEMNKYHFLYVPYCTFFFFGILNQRFCASWRLHNCLHKGAGS
jgi:hypothetical protein